MLIERILILLIILGMIFEVFIPLWEDHPLFPHFRQRHWEDAKLARAKRRLEAAERAREIAAIEAKAKQIEEENKPQQS